MWHILDTELVEERIAAMMEDFEKKLPAKDSITITMKEEIATLKFIYGLSCYVDIKRAFNLS